MTGERRPRAGAGGGGLRLDHVTIAGPSLDAMRERFRSAGLETVYGGPHSNGATHMALLGFDDGSYVELISLLEAGRQSPLWHRQIVEDGGAAAWAVVAEALEAEVERLRALGLPVRGPVPYHRARPDGSLVEWDLAFPGDHPPGAVHPFLIRDRTPRERRVRPSPSVAASELEGVTGVVLAVREPGLRVDELRRAWGGGEAEEGDVPALDARVAHLSGTPLWVARPTRPSSPLTRRIERFGDAPCFFLVRSRDLGATARRLGAGDGAIERGGWLGRDLLRMGSALGFVE